jgi:hypothetical protein
MGRQQASRFRTETFLDIVMRCVLRVSPLESFHKPLVKGYSITPREMIESRLLLPESNGHFNFVPIMSTKMIKMISTALAREKQMKNALILVSSLEDQIRGREPGLVFERHHAAWYLAMKAHQTRNTFLRKARYTYDPDDIHKAQLNFLFEGVSPGKTFIINRLPKCSLIDLFNNVEPHCSKPANPFVPFLLFPRYSIEEAEIDDTLFDGNFITKNALDLITNAQLQRLLCGHSLIQNIDRGAGYDYVEVNWLVENGRNGEDELCLSFDFIEMKYSNPLSSVKLSMVDIMQKYRLVTAAYNRLIKERLGRMDLKVKTRFRLIICSWRPLNTGVPIEKLPDNIYIYDLENLSKAYGPSLINQGPFISQRNKKIIDI